MKNKGEKITKEKIIMLLELLMISTYEGIKDCEILEDEEGAKYETIRHSAFVDFYDYITNEELFKNVYKELTYLYGE